VRHYLTFPMNQRFFAGSNPAARTIFSGNLVKNRLSNRNFPAKKRQSSPRAASQTSRKPSKVRFGSTAEISGSRAAISFA